VVGRAIRTLASGMAFLEAPRWHRNMLYASDVYGHRVVRFGYRGRPETVCWVPGRPCGLGWDAQGALVVASMSDRRILRYRDGRLERFAELERSAPGDLNDLVVDRHGGLYVGNFGSMLESGDAMRSTQLIRVDADGTHQAVGDELVFPNGMAIAANGSTLLVAETFTFRISAFDIAEDGSLTDRRDWAVFGSPLRPPSIDAAVASRQRLPDGICLDVEGALWVGDAGGHGAFRVSEGGQVLDEVRTPGVTAYAVALGGRDRRTLYMCAAPPIDVYDPTVERRGVVLACRVNVPGTPDIEPTRRPREAV